MDYSTILDLVKRAIQHKRLNTSVLSILLQDNTLCDEIHHEAIKEIRKTLSSYSEISQNPYAIILSMMVVGLKEYHGNFWQPYTEIIEVIDNYSMQKIHNVIRNQIRPFIEPLTVQRQINFPLMLVVVPVTYLSHFFDFMYDVYKNNFRYAIPSDFNDEMAFLFDVIRDRQNDFEDSISISGKVYRLIKSTRELIESSYDTPSLIDYCKRIIEIIDDYVKRRVVPSREDIYFFTGFDAWVSKNNQSLPRPIDSLPPLESHLSRAIYRYTNSDLWIKTPDIKIKLSQTDAHVEYVVTNEGTEISRGPLQKREPILGGFRYLSDLIKLLDFHKSLQIKIYVHGLAVYDSKTMLFRKLLIFNRWGYEIQDGKYYDDEAYFVTSGRLDPVIPITKQTGRYTVGKCVVIPNRIYIIDGIPVIFSAAGENCLVGNKVHGVEVIGKDKLSIYNAVSGCLLSVSKTLQNNMVIRINGIQIDDCVVEFKEESAMLFLGFPNNVELGANFIEVENTLNHSIVFQKRLILDPTFSFEMDEVKDQELLINIQCSFAGNQNNSRMYQCIIHFPSTVALIEDENVYLELDFSKRVFFLANPASKHQNYLGKYVWSPDFVDSGLIHIYAHTPFSYSTTNLGEISSSSKSTENPDVHYASLDLSRFPRNAGNSKISIYVEDELSIETCVMRTNKLHAFKNSVVYNPIDDIISGKVEFTGKNVMSINLVNQYDRVVESSRIVQTGSFAFESASDQINNVGFLIVCEHDPIDNDFHEIARMSLHICKYSSIVNRYLELREVTIEKYTKNEKTPSLIEVVLVNHYLYISKQIAQHTFEGRLYTRSRGQNIYLDKINPVTMIVDHVSPYGSMYVEMKDNEDDGLIINLRPPFITNSNASRDCPDLFEGVLHLPTSSSY